MNVVRAKGQKKKKKGRGVGDSRECNLNICISLFLFYSDGEFLPVTLENRAKFTWHGGKRIVVVAMIFAKKKKKEKCRSGKWRNGRCNSRLSCIARRTVAP